jgi:NADH-quinone oxidoreductase subunit N
MKALILLVILGIILLYGEFARNKTFLIPLAVSGLLSALAFTLMDWNSNLEHYQMVLFDNFALAFNALIIITAILIFLLAGDYFRGVKRHVAEIYALIIFCIAGTFMMTAFSNMAILFIGVETMSIPLYILAGSKKFSLRSNEASFKYFLLSSIATAIFLFGVVMIYGVTVSFSLDGIAEYIRLHRDSLHPLFKIGMLFVTMGFVFKVAAVPFHFWVPDVYEGSPTLITAFMATIVKVAGFAAFYRLFIHSFGELSENWKMMLLIITALTLVIGNISAIRQTNVKRLLAYSGIAHTGFMLMAMISLNDFSAKVLLFYAISYCLASIPAFGILILVKNYKGANAEIDAFNGLGKRNPIFGVMMTISLLSLSGIPLTAGFFAKYYVFLIALQHQYYWLVILAICMAMVGVFYYFRLIIAIYFREGETGMITCGVPYLISLIFATLLTLALGIVPSLVLGLNI